LIEIRRIVEREEIYRGIDLWNKIYPSFLINSFLVEQNIFTPFDGIIVSAWGVLEESNLLAFALTKYLTIPIVENGKKDVAWISLLVFDQENIKSDSIKSRLLETIERYLAEQEIKKIYFGRDPQNFIPGLPDNLKKDYLPWLEKNGYHKEGIVYDLYQDISTFAISSEIRVLEQRLASQLAIKAVTEDTKRIFLSFMKTFFPGRWHYEADNIARIPGAVQDYWLLWLDNKPVGFARTNTSESLYRGPNVNWGSQKGRLYCGLGPIGIADSYRGKGYGMYLMVKIIQNFQQKGYRHMIIDWTDLLSYYARLNFKPWIKYYLLYKNL